MSDKIAKSEEGEYFVGKIVQYFEDAYFIGVQGRRVDSNTYGDRRGIYVLLCNMKGRSNVSGDHYDRLGNFVGPFFDIDKAKEKCIEYNTYLSNQDNKFVDISFEVGGINPLSDNKEQVDAREAYFEPYSFRSHLQKSAENGTLMQGLSEHQYVVCMKCGAIENKTE